MTDLINDILERIKKPWVKKVRGKYTSMMVHVLHPHGLPFFRKLWTTKQQRDEHDER